MTGINHKLAQRYLRAAADGLIRDNQRIILEAHLRECDSCRAEADELKALEACLQKNFQAKWDANDGPSKNVMTTIQSRSWRIIMTNRINTGLKIAAGIAALLLLGVLFNPVFKQVREYSAQNNSTPGNPSAGTSDAPGELLAFVSEKTGNPDIYTMHADGSGLINLTDNPAQDINPVWSPDGTRIAFESDRSGFKQIFVMNADGSNIIQLTDDKADHTVGGQSNQSLSTWSPDGNKLIFSEKVSGYEKVMLYTMDINGENKKPLVKEAGRYVSPSWSPDGKHIAFIVVVTEQQKAQIYITDASGSVPVNIMKTLQADENLETWDYSWSRDGQSISFITSGSVPSITNENNKSYTWNAHEASLDGNTLITNATSRSSMEGYWQGIYFSTQSSAYTWVREDGKVLAVYPLMNCKKLPDGSGGFSLGGSFYKQSTNGNVLVGAYCPNGDIWMFWVNSKGTVFMPLLNSPIHSTQQGFVNELDWSLDDRFIAFNSEKNMYILNVSKSLKDPSTQPVQIPVGDGTLSYSLAWQPKRNTVKTAEEKPTPTPLAFSLTVKEAETLAGFDVLEPTYLPEGYIFNGASYNFKARWVELGFISQPEGSDYLKIISIHQQRGTFILGYLYPYETPVPIGDIEGVFIRGSYVSYDPESPTTDYKWDPSADSYSLIWKIDDMSFSINFMGGEGIPPIPLADLVAIAESMK